MSDQELEPVKHDIRLQLITRGSAPYGHKTWAKAIEAMLISELTGVDEAKVIEDWV